MSARKFVSFKIQMAGLLLIPLLLFFQNCSPSSSIKDESHQSKSSSFANLQGNGEGYSGAVGKYHHYDPNSCNDDQNKISSTIEVSDVDTENAYLTRENCQDISPRAVPKSSIGLKPHNLAHALYQKRVFERENLLGSTKTFCRTDQYSPEDDEKREEQAKVKEEQAKAKEKKAREKEKEAKNKSKEEYNLAKRETEMARQEVERAKEEIERIKEEIKNKKEYEIADFYIQSEDGQLYANVKVGLYHRDKLLRTIDSQRVPIVSKNTIKVRGENVIVYRAQSDNDENWFQMQIQESSMMGSLSVYPVSEADTKKKQKRFQQPVTVMQMGCFE